MNALHLKKAAFQYWQHDVDISSLEIKHWLGTHLFLEASLKLLDQYVISYGLQLLNLNVESKCSMSNFEQRTNQAFDQFNCQSESCSCHWFIWAKWWYICVFHFASTSRGMIFVSFFFGFFYVCGKGESLSVEPIYPHLLPPGPCMFFSLKVCVCGNAKLISQVCWWFLIAHCCAHIPYTMYLVDT